MLRFLREDSPVSCDSYYGDDGRYCFESLPTDVLWVRRAIEEGRIRRDLPFDSSMWSKDDRVAFDQAFKAVDRGPLTGTRWPQPEELQAVLASTRDLPDLRPRDPADPRWPLP